MPDKVLVTESSLQSIAAAIRTKNGLTTTYLPSEMGAAILAISTDNFEGVLAPAYEDYAFPIPQGAHCVYEGEYYIANQTISTAEDFDSAHWDLVTIGEEITDLQAALDAIDLSVLCPDGAGPHNGAFRGKYLGAEVTSDQWAAISAGTFEDLFIGDYWTIDGVNWRIAAFDYWYRTGSTICTTHHALIVPDDCLLTGDGSTTWMNTSNTTTGAYVGSGFYSGTNADGTTNTGKATCVSLIEAAFGAAHILSHKEYLKNAMSSGGHPSAGAFYDSTVELMNEQMAYGAKVYGTASTGTSQPISYTLSKTQLPLFALAPQYLIAMSGSSRQTWWLRDAINLYYFAVVHATGAASMSGASAKDAGLRPCFAICA